MLLPGLYLWQALDQFLGRHFPYTTHGYKRLGPPVWMSLFQTALERLYLWRRGLKA